MLNVCMRQILWMVLHPTKINRSRKMRGYTIPNAPSFKYQPKNETHVRFSDPSDKILSKFKIQETYFKGVKIKLFRILVTDHIFTVFFSSGLLKDVFKAFLELIIRKIEKRLCSQMALRTVWKRTRELSLTIYLQLYRRH